MQFTYGIPDLILKLMPYILMHLSTNTYVLFPAKSHIITINVHMVFGVLKILVM